MPTHLRMIFLCCLVSACAVPGTADRFAKMSTHELWSEHLLPRSANDLAAIEVELAGRGQHQWGTDYLGRTTASAYGKHLYTRQMAGRADLDCADFPSAAAAQRYFLRAGGPSQDPNGLDRDGDGLACEWGTELRRYVQSYHAPPRFVTRPSYSGVCHTGPRGGRYRITASGRKDYGSC